ncbi:MAG: hypothetical protein JXB05_15170 [Myxococcaceae bacterium]|nr:hypothetical protein [Myxococcaceae bacterium]
MTRFAKKMVPVLAVAVLGGASLAHAGATYQMAYCSKSPDGSGSCNGTFLGFRNDSGASTQAYFYKNDGGFKSFYGAFTNPLGELVTAGCIPDAATGALWSKALAHEGYFSISWDSSGTCTYLYLANSSQYSTF